MSNPIRLLHFADVHVGMENYGRLDLDTGTSTRVRDFLDRMDEVIEYGINNNCLLYTSPSPRDGLLSRMPSSA